MEIDSWSLSEQMVDWLNVYLVAEIQTMINRSLNDTLDDTRLIKVSTAMSVDTPYLARGPEGSHGILILPSEMHIPRILSLYWSRATTLLLNFLFQVIQWNASLS